MKIPVIITLALIVGLSLLSLDKAYGLEESPQRFVIFLGYETEEVDAIRGLWERSFTDLPSEFSPLLEGETVHLVPAPNTSLNKAYYDMLPMLREKYPAALFVFVTENDRFMFDIIGQSEMGISVSSAKGAAFISGGFAVVMGDISVVNSTQHELAHLVLCGTWHNQHGQNTGEIVRYPNADRYGWC